jgi:predicted alpha/beta hydrolase
MGNEEFVDCGNDRIAVQLFPADGDTFGLFWPAMGVPARFYRRFAEQLGFTVAVADLRGTGASTPTPSRASRYDFGDLVGDVGTVLEALKPHRDDRRTVLMGHSLGGQAAAVHLAVTGRSDVDGLALVAVGLPYWRCYPARRRLPLLAMTQSIALTGAVLGVWPGWGFGGRQAAGVMRDWAHTARVGSYPRVAGVDAEAALRDLRAPVFSVDVEGDRLTPATTVDQLVGKMPSATVTRVHYAADEAGAALDHFAWAKHGAPLAARIRTWADRLPGPPPD